MFLLITRSSKLENDIWAGSAMCPYCNTQSHFHLKKHVENIGFFYIPVIPATRNRYICCDNCGARKELKSSQYKKIKSAQLKQLDSGTYPRELTDSDCNPKNNGFWLQLVKLVLSGLLAFFMVAAAFGMVINAFTDDDPASGGFGMVLIVLVMFAPFILPFVFSLKNFIPKLKMKKIYKETVKYQ